MNKIQCCCGLVLFAACASLAKADDVTLTQDEASTVQMILKKDKMITKLVASQKSLDWLAKFLRITVTGPVKLAVQWDQSTLEGWRHANTVLVALEKQATCDDIDLQIAGGTQNEDFFDQLKKARGCDD
jgi:hypothetical protein